MRVKALDNGADIKVKQKDGWTALMMAAIDGYTDTVKALLDKGADVNAKNNKGQTALDWARENGQTATVKLLKQHGATE